MFYNMKVRTQFLYIMQEQDMSDNPKISGLSNHLFVQGVREHIKVAKQKKMDPREAAFYCIYKALKAWGKQRYIDNMKTELQGPGTMTNSSVGMRFWIALSEEHKEKKPDWVEPDERYHA